MQEFIFLNPFFFFSRVFCECFTTPKISSVGEEVRSVFAMNQIWTSDASAGLKNEGQARRWWKTLGRLVTKRHRASKSWQGLLQNSASLLSARVRSLSPRACGMARSARPGWGLARQLKKRSSQATEALITGPDWGHQRKLPEDTQTLWGKCGLIDFPDNYFD